MECVYPYVCLTETTLLQMTLCSLFPSPQSLHWGLAHCTKPDLSEDDNREFILLVLNITFSIIDYANCMVNTAYHCREQYEKIACEITLLWSAQYGGYTQKTEFM